MRVSPAELTDTAEPPAVDVPEPASPALSVEAQAGAFPESTESTESNQVLITTHQVLLGTAAARGLHGDQTGGRFGNILRRFFGNTMDETRPPRHDVPRRYGFLENAEMAREMFRL